MRGARAEVHASASKLLGATALELSRDSSGIKRTVHGLLELDTKRDALLWHVLEHASLSFLLSSAPDRVDFRDHRTVQDALKEALDVKPCELCGGSGWKPDGHPVPPCDACSGKGWTR